jgi:hypothetical protein
MRSIAAQADAARLYGLLTASGVAGAALGWLRLDSCVCGDDLCCHTALTLPKTGCGTLHMEHRIKASFN